MAKLSKELSVGTLHPRETLFLSGTLAGVGAEIVLPCDGSASVCVDVRGTFNLSFVVEASVDGTNWTAIPMRPLNQASTAYVVTIGNATNGIWAGSLYGFRFVRARCTVYTSGAAICMLSANAAPLDQSLSGTVTNQLGTAVGAAAAAVTLTIATPGVGLRHYLTYIAVQRVNGTAAALTAAAGPVNVTSTNIPGAMIIPFANDALPAGAIDRWREDFAYPLAASAQNTATTIVCPATPGVIWRVTAGYYVAP